MFIHVEQLLMIPTDKKISIDKMIDVAALCSALEAYEPSTLWQAILKFLLLRACRKVK